MQRIRPATGAGACLLVGVAASMPLACAGPAPAGASAQRVEPSVATKSALSARVTALGHESRSHVDRFAVYVDDGTACSSVDESGNVVAWRRDPLAERAHVFVRTSGGLAELLPPRGFDLPAPTQSLALPRKRGEFTVGFLEASSCRADDSSCDPIRRVTRAALRSATGWTDVVVPDDLVAYQIYVTDVSASGVAVGTIRTVDKPFTNGRELAAEGATKRSRAFAWDGAFHLLEGATQSAATAVTPQGDVAGMITENGRPRAVRWHAGVMERMGPDGVAIEVYDMNASGVMVGSMGDRAHSQAVVVEGSRAVPLGTLGGARSWASAISDDGRVFGTSDAGSRRHAFVWDRAKLVDLHPTNARGALEQSWITDATPDGRVLVGRATTSSGATVCVQWKDEGVSP
ncbi:MAG TPA: hypothetical protein VF765_08015 [Polyangiaceae bacterium]